MDPSKYPGCSGTRNLHDNLSDLKAQVAANHKVHLNIPSVFILYYYDYRLSNARRKFGDQVLTFNLCCCQTLTLWAAKAGEIAGDNSVTNGNEEIFHGNTVILVQIFVTKAPPRLN